MGNKKPLVSVEVAYAEGDKQMLIRLCVVEGSTVLEVIAASTVLLQFPNLAGEGILRDRVGIFGKTVALDTPLKAGDRVEIYRDLIRNPKVGRRLKAQDGKRKRAQAFDERKRKQKAERKMKALAYKKEKSP